MRALSRAPDLAYARPYAVYADSSAGIAVLGSQGDVWDAQKDMLSDGLGSIFASLVFFYIYRNEIKQVKAPV